MSISIRSLTTADVPAWAAQRHALWPDEDAAELARELALYFTGDLEDVVAALGAFGERGELLGFAELSIRRYAEGCVTSRVGYLEGWFVAPEARRRGVGRALVAASLDWARGQGCTEFASDALLENEVSHAAHRALGFDEVCRVVTYRQSL